MAKWSKRFPRMQTDPTAQSLLNPHLFDREVYYFPQTIARFKSNPRRGRSMTTIRSCVVPLMITILWVLPLEAQSRSESLSVAAIAERLDQLEQRNSELLEQVSTLRRELNDLKRPAPASSPDTSAALAQQS